jgi:hypothetical protein
MHQTNTNFPTPSHWNASCTHSENSLHQISPYIGKIKSSIASNLIQRFSLKGDLVVDPFCGSGTIPLEAACLGRNVFASDISTYSAILTQSKLFPPATKEEALQLAAHFLEQSRKLPAPDMRRIPKWVKAFFHRKTLDEILRFTKVCKDKKNYFLLGCLLGILHHQRPGFLSYPSSHLVPYLREKKFPKACYPELYKYRDLEPRLYAKIDRVYKRIEIPKNYISNFVEGSVVSLTWPKKFDCLITSPPYMNALDYVRDNRLRIWFLNENSSSKESPSCSQLEPFLECIYSVGKQIESGLRRGGHAVFVVGETTGRNKNHPAQGVLTAIKQSAPSVKLVGIIEDDIPDVRRSRRDCRGVKREQMLIFQK